MSLLLDARGHQPDDPRVPVRIEQADAFDVLHHGGVQPTHRLVDGRKHLVLQPAAFAVDRMQGLGKGMRLRAVIGRA